MKSICFNFEKQFLQTIFNNSFCSVDCKLLTLQQIVTYKETTLLP